MLIKLNLTTGGVVEIDSSNLTALETSADGSSFLVHSNGAQFAIEAKNVAIVREVMVRQFPTLPAMLQPVKSV